MGDAKIRYAEGEIGKLYGFTGGDVPPGTTPLTEEHDGSLTEAGKKYCDHRKLNPHPETIRILFGEQSSYVISDAVKASIKNQETRVERHNQAKEISERLRLDWMAQDKAYQDAVKERK